MLSPFASLPKYMRFTVYSFLDLETVASLISLLSVEERENLRTSAIAREGKHVKFSSDLIPNEQSLFWKYKVHLIESL